MKVDFGCQMLHVARRFADREALVNIERGRRYRFMDFHLLTNKIANMVMDRFGAEIDHIRRRASHERGRKGAPQEGPGEILEGETTEGELIGFFPANPWD